MSDDRVRDFTVRRGHSLWSISHPGAQCIKESCNGKYLRIVVLSCETADLESIQVSEINGQMCVAGLVGHPVFQIAMNY